MTRRVLAWAVEQGMSVRDQLNAVSNGKYRAWTRAELAKAKDENESLQLNLMEQEELHGTTTARIQALIERASSATVGA